MDRMRNAEPQVVESYRTAYRVERSHPSGGRVGPEDELRVESYDQMCGRMLEEAHRKARVVSVHPQSPLEVRPVREAEPSAEKLGVGPEHVCGLEEGQPREVVLGDAVVDRSLPKARRCDESPQPILTCHIRKRGGAMRAPNRQEGGGKELGPHGVASTIGQLPASRRWHKGKKVAVSHLRVRHVVREAHCGVVASGGAS